MSRVSGDLPSAPQATVEPIVFFVRVSVDTIHRRLQEYSGRIARRYAAFSALSVAITFGTALLTSDFGPEPMGMFWKGVFYCGFLVSLFTVAYCGFRAAKESSLASVDHVVKQIAGQADVDSFEMHPVNL